MSAPVTSVAPETLAEARARNIRDALAEDVGPRDHTATLIHEGYIAQAHLVVREPAVLCGREWFEGCLHALDPAATVHWQFKDGDDMPANSRVCEIQGQARALLTAERSALNFLQMLSATATQARRHSQAIAGLSPNPKGCAVYDTRKTIPGLRLAQKYAVRVGGGQNQRLALWDGILIKENHIAAAGGIAQALEAARALQAGVSIQIEVESLEELHEALKAGAENILLDNLSLADMKKAVEIAHGTAVLEASGGIGLEGLAAIAQTGVDRISIGKLTKDIQAVDYSMRIVRISPPAG